MLAEGLSSDDARYFADYALRHGCRYRRALDVAYIFAIDAYFAYAAIDILQIIRRWEQNNTK